MQIMLKDKETFVIFLLIFGLSDQIIDGHVCNYRMPKLEELVNGISIQPLPPNFRQKRDASSNLKILFEYTDSFTSSTQADALKTQIMEPAKNQLQSLLTPKAPVNGVLLVDRQCESGMVRINNNGTKGCATSCATTTCLGELVPDKYLKQCVVIQSNGNEVYSGIAGAGVANYDIVLLVTYKSCSGSTLAFAASCFSENTIDRPILGVVNLCSNRITTNSRVKENTKVVMHEIIHALGVAIDKYAFYRYDNGTPIVPRNGYGLPSLGVTTTSQGGYYNWNDVIIKPVIRNRQSISQSYTLTFYGFVLPNVLTAARNHFNCPSLEAVDLENYGSLGDGSYLSHLDEYFLNNELMTPVSNDDLDILSNITLALLQDTGWYIANYSAVGNLDYGYQTGCTIPQKGCYAYMQSLAPSASLYPFCNKPYAYGRSIGCSDKNDYFYYCSLYKMPFVNPMYQYFSSIPGVASSDVQFYSGSSPYNEYCPIRMVFSDPSSICSNVLNNNLVNSKNFVQSYYGADSMCFLNDMYYAIPNILFGASCQKYSINAQTNQTIITIDNKQYTCPSSVVNNFTVSSQTLILRCPGDNSLQTLISLPSQGRPLFNLQRSLYVLVCLFSANIWS